MTSTGKRTAANGKEQRELKRARRALKAGETTFDADTLDRTAVVYNLTGEEVVLWSEDGNTLLRSFPPSEDGIVASVFHSAGLHRVKHGLPVLVHSLACVDGVPTHLIPGKHIVVIVPPEVGAVISARRHCDGLHATYIGPDMNWGLLSTNNRGVAVKRFILYQARGTPSAGGPSGGVPR